MLSQSRSEIVDSEVDGPHSGEPFQLILIRSAGHGLEHAQECDESSCDIQSGGDHASVLEIAKALAQLQEATGADPAAMPQQAVAVLEAIATRSGLSAERWRTSDTIAGASLLGIGGLAWRGGSYVFSSAASLSP